MDLFVATKTGKLVLDLNKVMGIHLSLASVVSFGFAHVTGFIGPGMWTSDCFGLVGSVRFIKLIYSLIGLGLFCYGVISSNHIVAGIIGIYVGLWHISSRPGPFLYKLVYMSNIEGVLSSSITSLLFTAFIMTSLMWYGSVICGLELFGPSRFHWDTSYFTLEIEGRVNLSSNILLSKAFSQVPEILVLYDYIGCNPSKGGLFRYGPIFKGDGIIQNWLGHASFETGTLSLIIRRMPAFFETFPVILIDQGGTLRADVPFRRAESRYSIEQTSIALYFSGGILNSTEYRSPSLVKSYARKAQFGEIFSFDKNTALLDGVFRTSPRGWYSFSHVTFGLLFLFGHLWHASRSLFREIWTGLTIITIYQVEYGRNEKLGDKSTTS